MAEAMIVFVKSPRPGQVKTRLARTLGAQAACAAYQQMVKRLLNQLARLRPVELWFTPDDAAEEIRAWLRPGWECRPQGQGDLGCRLERAFADAFSRGAQRVVILGSDCPEATTRDVRDAWRALRTEDLVLGPALDGGYWLIGLQRPQPALFANIPWSSDTVLSTTLERARSAGLRLQLLRLLADVDTEKEWQSYLPSGEGA